MSNEQNIETVVFDLGGVLVDWNPRHLYRKIFTDEAEMEYFLTHICTQEWNEHQDRGRPWAEGIALLCAQHPDYETPIRAYYERWQEMLNGAIEETVKVLEDLHQHGIRLLALTNWSGETFHFAEEKFPFLHLFEGILVSGNENLMKPDPRIFTLLIERYNLNPQRTVFVDDSLRNVEAAINMGIHGLHFTGARQLEKDLAALGVR
ncbi:HAD family hydrolase [Glaesserella sp.]|uniref:HAD family hydrolase n=1 Tax=Glaesserella sp. TaxID=2094731 RepID=UPI00359F806B